MTNNTPTAAEIIDLLDETDAPTQPDEGFLQRAMDEIYEMAFAFSASSASSQQPVSGSLDIETTEAYVAMETWMVNDVNYQVRQWMDNVRVVNALRAGIKSGDIALRSRDDLEMMYFIPQADFSRFPQLVEHYVSTGEFMELMSAVLAAFGCDGGVSGWTMSSRVRMFRAYAFDLSADDKDIHTVPLAIRLGLAGFYDEITDVEVTRDQGRSYDLDDMPKT